MSKIFISYARKDHFFVSRLREDLERAGIDYWIDHEGLAPGTDSWERAIRAALKACESVLWLVSPSSFASAYVRDEISIARMYERKIYPIFAEGDNWLECVPLGTGEIQYIDARENYDEARDKILKTLGASESIFIVPDEPRPTLPAGQDPRNPYKGLSAFSEKDTDDFFGRETLVKKLQTRIIECLDNEQNRFLAVMGPSGAGKSSVVMAGLIPSLKNSHENWVFLPKIVPGNHPVEALSDALNKAMPEKSLSAIEVDLNNRGGRMLHRLARQIDAEQVILYIDQFEELFTLTEDENERQQFINLIAQAATEPDGKVVILLSMRADFYGHPANYPELGVLVNQNSELVLPMSISELRDAIEKPARLPNVALSFDSGLVAEIIFALRERDKALAGALPLLQFTLERLFADRDGTHLSFEVYQAMGGVQGAIGTHCEDVFSKLPDVVQAKLGQVFLPLVNIDEDTGESTRRRVELDAVIADSDAKILVDALIKNRLLQTGYEGELVYLEIAHESLFSSWERLAKWLEVTRDDLRLLRQVEREANDWDAGGRTYRMTAARLKPIYAVIERLEYKLSPQLDDFLYPQKMLLQKLEKLETTEQERMQIGIELAELGDPRAGVGVKDGLPDIEWLPVGVLTEPVMIKTNENEIGPVKIEPFYISKYLVTYAQYHAFAENDYDNLRWWRGFPEKYQPQKLSEQRTKSPNNPQDTISWYQSVAFSRWLDAKYREMGMFDNLRVGTPNGVSNDVVSSDGRAVAHPYETVKLNPNNWQIRLPTEWEWQWAAQNGTEERKYPWGAWKRGFADTNESGLGRAIAVGMYPHGAAKYGSMDMSGNLREWCLNDYDNPEKIDALSTAKVLRGGAFNYSRNHASCVSRNFNYLHLDNVNSGVRLILSPPIAL